MCTHMHDLQSKAYKYVSSGLWQYCLIFEVKITNMLKSIGWALEISAVALGELLWLTCKGSCRCFPVELLAKYRF